MDLRSVAVAAGLAIGLMSGTAQAATVNYNFSFDPFFNNGTGSFSGAFQVMNGEIVGISGSGATIGRITALLSPGSYPTYEPNDNAFSSGAPYLDYKGVSFTTSLAGSVNLYSVLNTYAAADDQATVFGALSVNLGAVPLPASAPMFGTALLALGAIGYGMKRKAAAA